MEKIAPNLKPENVDYTPPLLSFGCEILVKSLKIYSIQFLKYEIMYILFKFLSVWIPKLPIFIII